jgi:hypothetical protein
VSRGKGSRGRGGADFRKAADIDRIDRLITSITGVRSVMVPTTSFPYDDEDPQVGGSGSGDVEVLQEGATDTRVPPP